VINRRLPAPSLINVNAMKTTCCSFPQGVTHFNRPPHWWATLMLSFAKRALILSMILIIAACAGSDKGESTKDENSKDGGTKNESKKDENTDDNKSTPICPQVAIVRDLDVMKDYGREKPDPTQLVAQAKMLSITGDCEYQKGGIDVTFAVNMVAQRGPRLGGLHTGFPFFTAVVDPSETILNKENMTATFGFSSEHMLADDTESLHVFIPLSKNNRANGPSYRVLVGFQLPNDNETNPFPAAPPAP
jgi:hypothetical protein